MSDRPKCSCGRPAERGYNTLKDGTRKEYFRKSCAVCREIKKYGKRFRGRSYKKYKTDKCKECNFEPIHKCQLDVDHIDGNHKNNDPSNLQTLCANCHRLKTYKNKDWK